MPMSPIRACRAISIASLLPALALLFFSDASLAAAPRCTVASGMQRVSIQTIDGPRQLLLHAPASALRTGKAPLLFNLHGSGGNGEEQMRTSALSQLADRHGFIVAAPDGAVTLPAGGYAWNIPGVPTVAGTLPPADAPDDVAYVKAVIDTLVARGCVDPDRVYVTGISGGGRMASWLGCVLSDRIAAIAPVVGLRAGMPAGEPPMPDPATCRPTSPVAVIAFSGDADKTNPPGGGGARYWGYGLAAAERRWADLDGCTLEARTEQKSDVTIRRYAGCKAPVESRIKAGGGHSWDVADTDAMWAFLSLQRRAGQGSATPSVAVTNPLLPSGPDPSIMRDGADYYYMHTVGNRLELWRTRDLSALAQAERRVVWRPKPNTPNGRSIWAPELHHIDGKWYIYYTAADSAHDDDAHRGIFVLENAARDPFTGTWIDRGRLATAHPGIDGTTFTYRGKRYFAYSPYVGPDSDIAIVAMRDPVTLTGPETIIATPDRAWERQGGRQILEGPAYLPGPKGDLFLAYSGSACWSDDYAIGLLHAPAGSDPLDAKAWTKRPRPVMAKAPAAGVFAPGHNGFFTSPGGESWIVYHANPAAGMKCSPARSPRIQRVTWDEAGQPVFPLPAASGAALPAPR